MPVAIPKPTKKSPAAKGAQPFNPSGDELEGIVAGQAKATLGPRSPRPAKSKGRY
jgi:hypothetical protein